MIKVVAQQNELDYQKRLVELSKILDKYCWRKECDCGCIFEYSYLDTSDRLAYEFDADHRAIFCPICCRAMSIYFGGSGVTDEQMRYMQEYHTLRHKIYMIQRLRPAKSIWSRITSIFRADDD